MCRYIYPIVISGIFFPYLIRFVGNKIIVFFHIFYGFLCSYSLILAMLFEVFKFFRTKIEPKLLILVKRAITSCSRVGYDVIETFFHRIKEIRIINNKRKLLFMLCHRPFPFCQTFLLRFFFKYPQSLHNFFWFWQHIFHIFRQRIT